MSDDKKDSNSDWVFEIDDKLSLQAENITKVNEKAVRPPREKKLILEKPKINNSKSRAALYEELEEKNKKNLGDIIILAPLSRRLLSFILDIILYLFVSFISFKMLSYDYQLSDILLNKFKYQWDISYQVQGGLFILLNFFIFFSLFFIYPMVFHNATVGKLIFSLKVRGDKNYSLTLIQVIFREVIVKPLSIITIIGIMLPLFNKNKKSLHDFASGTLVIKE